MAHRRAQTREVHAGSADRPFGAINQPIFTSCTYEYETAHSIGGRYRYGRIASPTRDELEAMMTDLEGGTSAYAFASGMAAIDAVFSLLEPGAHVVAADNLYAETYDLLTGIYPMYGIDVSFVDIRRNEVIADAMCRETALVYFESPTNPLLHIGDIEAAAAIAHDGDAFLAIDNTFASPALQRPLELGADIVVESLTKYIGGHSDAILGSVVVDDPSLEEQLSTIQYTRGAIPGSLECFLAVRGGRTLSRRVEVQCANARAIAEWMEAHEMVDHVYYPGQPNHPNHDIATRQMDDYGAMVSLDLKGGEPAATAFVEALEIFTLAESLGAVESLVEVPALMTHQDIPPEKRAASGISDGLVRLSIGIEHVDDLIDDIRQGLQAVELGEHD